jgi:signal transduction histidine kinase
MIANRGLEERSALMLDLNQHLHIPAADGSADPDVDQSPANHRNVTGLNDAVLCEMQHRLLDSEENERQRLAQELHDGPLQELHSLDFKLVAMARQMEDDQQQAQLSEMRSTLRHLARHLRAICQDLRPPALTPFGVGAVLRSFAESFQQNHRELTVVVDLDDDGQKLSERARLALYRICQHGLRNVAQHAEATRVYVGLRVGENTVQLCIEDNGKGLTVPLDWPSMIGQGRYGLLGCVERAEAVGGHVTILSEPGQGTRLRVVVPLDTQEHLIPNPEATEPAVQT